MNLLPMLLLLLQRLYLNCLRHDSLLAMLELEQQLDLGLLTVLGLIS
jgi:hypothetical protein